VTGFLSVGWSSGVAEKKKRSAKSVSLHPEVVVISSFKLKKLTENRVSSAMAAPHCKPYRENHCHLSGVISLLGIFGGGRSNGSQPWP